ncbi:MAG: linear amide C-N hydrolase [Lysobacter sp.]
MCTNFLLAVPTTPAGATPSTQYISARCMELTGAMKTSMYLLPAQQKFPLFPGRSTSWVGRYGFVALADSQAMPEFPCFVDGINSEGLSCAALWLPGTEYGASASGDALEFHDLVAWVMSQFASVADLLTALGSVTVIGPKAGNPLYLPLHFIATDTSGASVVLEFINGAMNVYPPSYDNGATSDGVLTNSPTYDWQRTNLASYAHLSVEGAGTSTTDTSGPPVGAGLLGLPGDIMSASRFVKAWTLRQGYDQLRERSDWLPTPKNAGATDSTQTIVNVALSLVQTIQATPYGSALISPKSKLDPPKVGDWTMWQVARDHSNAVYYFSSAFNSIVQKVDLSELDFGGGSVKATDLKSLPVLPAPGAWYNDVSSSFGS